MLDKLDTESGKQKEEIETDCSGGQTNPDIFNEDITVWCASEYGSTLIVVISLKLVSSIIVILDNIRITILLTFKTAKYDEIVSQVRDKV